MYKFYWSNLQKSQSGNGAHHSGSHSHHQQQQQPFSNSHQSRDEVWTRQSNSTSTAMPVSSESRFGNNPEPLPARSGRPGTTVRVTSPSGHDRESRHANSSSQKSENKSGQHHTPTGSHRVLLKLRRGAQAARPKSVHGAEQVTIS